jgi:hypothetical protein
VQERLTDHREFVGLGRFSFASSGVIPEHWPTRASRGWQLAVPVEDRFDVVPVGIEERRGSVRRKWDSGRAASVFSSLRELLDSFRTLYIFGDRSEPSRQIRGIEPIGRETICSSRLVVRRSRGGWPEAGLGRGTSDSSASAHEARLELHRLEEARCLPPCHVDSFDSCSDGVAIFRGPNECGSDTLSTNHDRS